MLYSVLFLLLLVECHGLLQSESTHVGIDDLYVMIQQMNKTIHHLEAVTAQQDNIIAKLNSSAHSNVIAFYARISHSLSNLGDNQAIEFDQVITNEGGSYDPRHGHFIAPIPGIYIFSASILSEPGHTLECEMVKNGQIVARLYGGRDDYQGDTKTFPLKMQKGDMVWIRHRSGYQNQILHSNSYSYFSGCLIDA